MNPNLIPDKSKAALMLFFSNIDYLRQSKGITVRSMLIGFKDKYGYSASRHTLRKYRTGLYWKADIQQLVMYADYFGQDVSAMLSVDYSLVDSLK